MLLSALPLVVLPPGLREQVLRLVANVTPEAVSYRARLVRQAGRFRADGFPVPVAPMPSGRPGSREVVAAAALTAAGILTVLAMTLAWPSMRHTAAATGLPAASSPSAGSPAAAPQATAAATVSPSAPGTRRAAGAPPAGTTPGSTPSGSSPPASSPPAPSPSAKRTPRPGPSASAKPGTLSAAPVKDRLAQSPLGGPYAGTFTLTGAGGAVAFTIALPPADAAGLAVTPEGGSLAAGQSITITVTAVGNGPPYYVSPLTVNPGVLTVDVEYPPQG